MCIGGLFAGSTKARGAEQGREAFETACQRQYSLLQYGLSNGLYARDEALTFLAALDGIRRRQSASRARSRKAADIPVRLEVLQAQMRRSQCRA